MPTNHPTPPAWVNAMAQGCLQAQGHAPDAAAQIANGQDPSDPNSQIRLGILGTHRGNQALQTATTGTDTTTSSSSMTGTTMSPFPPPQPVPSAMGSQAQVLKSAVPPPPLFPQTAH